MPLTLHSLTLSDIATIEAAIDALELDVDALQVDVTELQGDVDILETNVRRVSNVNMLNDNFTMSDEESNSLIILVANQGVGKTLSYSSATDATRPAIQYIVTLFATGNFTVANESGGTTIELSAGTVVQISSSPTLGGVVNTSLYSNINARGKTNGIRVIAGTTGSISDADKGKTIICTNALLTTITILSTIITTDFTCTICSTGAAGAIIAGDGTSVPSINTTLITKQSTDVCRDGATQNFYCV